MLEQLQSIPFFDSVILPVIFIILLILIWFLIKYIVFLLSDYKLYSNNGFFKTRGKKALTLEYIVFRKLRFLPIKKQLYVNIPIKSDKGTSKVNILMVTLKGIFLFEIHNKRGFVSGDERNSKWSVVVNSKKKITFPNPVIVTKSSTEGLVDIFPFVHPNLFYSYIIFDNNSDLSQIDIYNREISISNYSTFHSIIDKHIDKQPSVMPINRFDEITQKLEDMSKSSNKLAKKRKKTSKK